MSEAPSTAQSTSVPLAIFAAATDIPTIEDQLLRLQRKADLLMPGGLTEAANWCASNASAQILVVDIAGHPHPLAALLELATQSGPTCRIVALGTLDDVAFYRQLLSAGIFDYLLKPLRLDILADTLARAEEDRPLGQDGVVRAGRTVAVVGTSGGVGTSTLVTALGQWLTQVQHTPTVLVDFDRRQSDLPLLLGLEADAGLAHLLDAPAIDPRLLQRTLLNGSVGTTASRLQLLAQRPGPETPVHPERVLELGAALCQLFSLSLWDLPSHRPTGSDEVLTHADVRIVLTELNVQGARNTQRLLPDIGDERDGQQLLLVTSAAHHTGQTVLSAEQFESFVGRRIHAHVPHAGDTLAASLLQGALARNNATAYAQAIAGLGRGLLNLPSHTAQEPAHGLLQRLAKHLGLRQTPRQVSF